MVSKDGLQHRDSTVTDVTVEATGVGRRDFVVAATAAGAAAAAAQAQGEEPAGASRKCLDDVATALDFLEKTTTSKELSQKLEGMARHDDVIRFAAQQGYKINRETLAEAMKILVDRSLANRGIPSWVRARIHAPAHD